MQNNLQMDRFLYQLVRLEKSQVSTTSPHLRFHFLHIIRLGVLLKGWRFLSNSCGSSCASVLFLGTRTCHLYQAKNYHQPRWIKAFQTAGLLLLVVGFWFRILRSLSHQKQDPMGLWRWRLPQLCVVVVKTYVIGSRILRQAQTSCWAQFNKASSSLSSFFFFFLSSRLLQTFSTAFNCHVLFIRWETVSPGFMQSQCRC